MCHFSGLCYLRGHLCRLVLNTSISLWFHMDKSLYTFTQNDVVLLLIFVLSATGQRFVINIDNLCKITIIIVFELVKISIKMRVLAQHWSVIYIGLTCGIMYDADDCRYHYRIVGIALQNIQWNIYWNMHIKVVLLEICCFCRCLGVSVFLFCFCLFGWLYFVVFLWVVMVVLFLLFLWGFFVCFSLKIPSMHVANWHKFPRVVLIKLKKRKYKITRVHTP